LLRHDFVLPKYLEELMEEGVYKLILTSTPKLYKTAICIETIIILFYFLLT